jgi:hypothetical protein
MATAPRATWWRTAKLGPGSETLRATALANDTWVFVGYDTGAPRIYTILSDDFDDESPSFTTRTPSGTDPLNGVDHALAEAITVAVGDNGRVETSLDKGASWSNLVLAANPDLYDVVAVTGSTTALFVAVGDGAIWARTDAGSWSSRWLGAQLWRSVAYRSGVGWVAVGAGGNGTHSATAAASSFLAPYSIDTATLWDVEGNASYYLAGGTAGAVFRSATGLSGSWTQLTIDTTQNIGAIRKLGPDNDWALITYGGEIFVTANNGVTWSKSDYVIPDNVWSMSMGANMGSAVGTNGGIYYSANSVQADHVPVAAPTSGLAFSANADMAGDAVRRFATQFRSGR